MVVLPPIPFTLHPYLSPRLNTQTDAPENPADISRGVLSATTGIDRLLTLFANYVTRAT
jgi:hypothetical protein